MMTFYESILIKPHTIVLTATHARTPTWPPISPIFIANCKDLNMSRLKKFLMFKIYWPKGKYSVFFS